VYVSRKIRQNDLVSAWISFIHSNSQMMTSAFLILGQFHAIDQWILIEWRGVTHPRLQHKNCSSKIFAKFTLTLEAKLLVV